MSAFSAYQEAQAEPANSVEAWKQYLSVAELPDALLFWVLYRKLPALEGAPPIQRILLLQRLLVLLPRLFPRRPDLLYTVMMWEVTASLLRQLPREMLNASRCYLRHETYLIPLQAAWSQGRYQDMWLYCLRGQLDGRYLPLSDHHVRGFSIIGEAERCMNLLQKLYISNPSEFQLGSISNLFFMALGSEILPEDFCKL